MGDGTEKLMNTLLKYEDTESQANGSGLRDLIAGLKNCKVGDVVRFGAYDWFVYSTEDQVISLLCKEPVKKGHYHSENIPLTWEDCDLRKWLNGEFYDQFSEEEKKMIVKTHLKNQKKVGFFRIKAKSTDDYIFLLSIKEAEKIPTEILELDCVWWLRSPGYQPNRAADVYTSGSIVKNGCLFLHQYHGIRPALNLKISD